MIDYIRDIDFEKYKTFFLEYHKDNNVFSTHNVRPCTATYKEITDITKHRTITIEGSVIAFSHDTPLAEIIMNCAINGVSLDFIDIYVKKDEEKTWSDYKCVQSIDMHKEDISKYLEEIEAKRFYIALNKTKRNKLNYLIVDRFSQDNSIDFLKGEYDQKAIVAGFNDQTEARNYCKNKNNS